MFSPALEVILNIAFREAISRGHVYLTLEHLLYALAHDPDGERILGACGADLPALRRQLDEYLDESIERQKRGTAKDPEQTVAFRRVLQTAILHVQSAQREEANAGDILAAMLQQPKTYAAQLLGEHGVTRLDILNYISHGIAKVPQHPIGESGDGSGHQHAHGNEGHTPAAPDPLTAYCSNLTERARLGQLDPLIGRTDELQRTIEVLCRRRKNNPVFVGDPGVGKTALAEGLASRLLHDDVQGALAGAEVFALDTGALLAGTRFRGDFEERFKAVIAALAARTKPILFIDEMHSTVGAGAVTGGTMDLATMLKPLLTQGTLRVIGSTTFEEFKHIEKDRALARRLQKIAIEEPSIAETISILSGLRPSTKSITVFATPMPRSKRRLGSPRATCATTSCPTARSISSTKPAPSHASTRWLSPQKQARRRPTMRPTRTCPRRHQPPTCKRNVRWSTRERSSAWSPASRVFPIARRHRRIAID
ncbi:MAG: Clp protease N-terminal domain-containing protein [Vicinamibacterales bacterium]